MTSIIAEILALQDTFYEADILKSNQRQVLKSPPEWVWLTAL